jgi:ethanolamine ammonia-lyase small subunit
MTTLRADDFWPALRRSTPARIGLDRAGDAVATREVLEFETARMRARDAVHAPLDAEATLAALQGRGFLRPVLVTSQAPDRATYLRRPDLGRRPASLEAVPAAGRDVCLVLADGLSPRAVADHGPALAALVRDGLDGRHTVGDPVVALQARVALGDHVGARAGAALCIVLVGERPGLSVSDSLGAYLTHAPRPGRLDSERNCVSNVHPLGTDLTAAAAQIVALACRALERGVSGVGLQALSPPAGSSPNA